MEEKLKGIQKRTPRHDGQNKTLDQYSKMCFPGSFNYMDEKCLSEKNIDLLLIPVMNYLNTQELRTFKNN